MPTALAAPTRTWTLEHPVDLAEHADVTVVLTTTPTALTVSPRGDALVIGTLKGELIAHSARGDRVLWRCRQGSDTPRALGWLGEHLLVAGSGGTVRRIAVDPYEELGVEVAHRHGVNAVDAAPGRWLATASDDGTCRIRGEGSVPTVELAGLQRWATGVAVVDGGFTVVTGSSDGAVVRWDLREGTTEPLYLHGGGVTAVSRSPDGRLVATAGGDGKLRLWSTERRSLDRVWKAHTGAVTAIAWSPDGRWLASVGDDRGLAVWSAADAALRHHLYAHDQTPTAVVWSPDGATVWTGGRDHRVRSWPVARLPSPDRRPLRHVGAVRGVDLAGGRGIVSVGRDGAVALWDGTSFTLEAVLGAHDGSAEDVAVSPDGSRAATVGLDGALMVWDLVRRRRLWSVAAHDQPAQAVAWIDGQRLVGGGRDGRVRIRAAAGGELLADVLVSEQRVRALAVRPDGRRIAAASYDGSVTLLRTDGTPGAVLRGHTGSVIAVAWQDDHRLASGSLDGTVRVWDVQTGSTVAWWRAHEGGVTAIAPHEGGWLSVGLDGALRSWTAEGTSEGAHPLGRGADGLAVGGDRVVLGDRSGNVWCLREVVAVR